MSVSIPVEVQQTAKAQLDLLDAISRELAAKRHQPLAERVAICTQVLRMAVLEPRYEGQLHDYLTQFYEHHLGQLRQRIAQLELQQDGQRRKSKDLQRTLSSPSIVNPQEDFRLVSSQIDIKESLLHCQYLLQQNQVLAEQQNIVIAELRQLKDQAESRSHSMRREYEDRIALLDESVRLNTNSTNTLHQDLQAQRRVYETQIRELQIANASFLDQRHSMENEIVLKGEEIKLLTKKVYESTVQCTKAQRQSHAKQHIIVNCKNLADSLEQEVIFHRQRADALSKQWEHKFQETLHGSVLQDKQTYTYKSEMAQMQAKLTQKQIKIVSIEEELSKIKKSAHKAEEHWTAAATQKDRQFSEAKKSLKKLRLAEEELAEIREELQNSKSMAQEQENKIKELRTHHKEEQQRQAHQRRMLKTDLNRQFQDLTNLNVELLQRNLKLQQDLEIKQQQVNQLNYKIALIQTDHKVISQALGETRANLGKTQQQHTILRRHLQEQQTKAQELEKHRYGEIVALQKQNQQLVAKVSEISKVAPSHGESKAQKEDLVKKDFLIRQLQSKMNVLQQQLRQCEQLHENDRQRAQNKIRELEAIIKEKYGDSSRIAGEGLNLDDSHRMTFEF